MEKGLDFISKRRYRLTEKAINDLIDRVTTEYGVDILEVVENDDGYIFKGKYGLTIGDLTYDIKRGGYQDFNFYRGVVENIKEQDARMEKKSRRDYKIQRNKKIGIAITAAGIIVLSGIGVIRGINAYKDHASQQIGVVQEETHLTNVEDANDLVLVAWANYAIGEVSHYYGDSEYEALRSVKDDIYANLYAPLMKSYYDYLDCMDSGMPYDIVGTSMENYHRAFRSNVAEFNNYLEEANLDMCAFDRSPFSDAVVFDTAGNVVVSNERYKGEVKDSSGNLVTYDGDIPYSVYIQVKDIPNHDYSVTNLPVDAKVYNGENYVDLDHLYDFKNNNLGK